MLILEFGWTDDPKARVWEVRDERRGSLEKKVLPLSRLQYAEDTDVRSWACRGDDAWARVGGGVHESRVDTVVNDPRFSRRRPKRERQIFGGRGYAEQRSGLALGEPHRQGVQGMNR